VTLDVFLESFEEFDRDAVETALARNGIAGGNATVQTADGGEAQLELDDDGVVLFVRTLTSELADMVFDVARGARLAILPADGSATAIVTGDVPVSDELEVVRVATSRQLHETLQQSVANKDRARGARQA
jgi:hypothetical protein